MRRVNRFAILNCWPRCPVYNVGRAKKRGELGEEVVRSTRRALNQGAVVFRVGVPLKCDRLFVTVCRLQCVYYRLKEM